jgi:CheY-like chemotaxis protein/nitrogen-specific signal transduction histidine kinase
VIALVPLGYGIYRLRVRTLRRRNAELEKKVRDRTEELEAANASKTQFVANMSHDIRNPLNGIVGLAYALEDTRLDARQRELVATLRECTTYLSSLVDDVLDFASIEAGRVELRPRAYAPQELLRSIVETLKADATTSGASLSVHTSADVPPNLFGDAGRIQQILVNFVSNALKYAGGTIRLSVHIPANSPGEIEFAVTDEGPGISVEEQATLFTKFCRLHQKRGGEEIPGTGLGLAACRLLADIMGGAVGVQSRPGEGARFFLRLPLTVAVEPTTAPAASLPNTTVLLVEDTDYNAWAASAVLAKLGLACERAHTGAEGLELFRRKRYNIVLLDRNLPDMDGTEVARRMREMESDGLQAVLLAVTAYCTAEDRELCLQAGMDAFVGKPLTPEKLRKTLLAAGRRMLAAAPLHTSPDVPSVTLDFSLLTFLSDGSTRGVHEQIERYLEILEQAEAEVSAAVAARDFENLRTAAHRLLGHVKMVSATTLEDAAACLVAAARRSDGPACTDELRRVHEAIQVVTEAIRLRLAAPSV